MNFWERHAKLLFAAKMIHHLSVIGVYAAFPFLLVSTFLKQDNFFLTAILVCGWSFVFLSLYRKKHNAKRPREVYNIPSAIEKGKEGKSFPSRHSFSAAIISVCLFSPFGTTGLSLFVRNPYNSNAQGGFRASFCKRRSSWNLNRRFVRCSGLDYWIKRLTKTNFYYIIIYYCILKEV